MADTLNDHSATPRPRHSPSAYANLVNSGGASQLYTKLGFELERYEATYAKPV